MKRLLIFTVNSDVYRDSEYILFLLDSMKEYCEYIISCTSYRIETKLKDELEKRSTFLYQYPDYIDINRWKDVFLNKADKNIISNVDEIIFMNDSMFGPIYPMSEVFSRFDNEDVDFWGLTVHGEMKMPSEKRVFPRFLQTYFLAVRKSLFMSEEFHDYMSNLQTFGNYEKADREFQFIFTDYFSKKGFSWKSYIEMDGFEKKDVKFFVSFILFDIYYLVKEKRFPFIPKFLFEISELTVQTYNMCDDLHRAYEYVRDNTEYDTDLIINNIIRRLDLRDIADKLKLFYIFDGRIKNTDSFDNAIEKKKKYAVFAHLFYDDLFEYSIEKLMNVPEFFDIFITTSDDTKAEKLNLLIKEKYSDRKIHIDVFAGRGRDLAALLVFQRKRVLEYDIFAFVHDKKSSQMDYSTVGNDFNIHLWENMLDSRGYVEEVLDKLESDKYLGFMAPPMVYHGTYFYTAADSWTICYDKTRKVAIDLNVKVNINREKNPIALGSVFWCKTQALRPILEHEFVCEYFPKEPMPIDGTVSHAIERIFPYIAQQQGYYTGNILTVNNARKYMVAYQNDVNGLMREVRWINGIDPATCELTVLTLKNNIPSKFKKRRL